MKLQPKQGRYFAVDPGRVASATRGWEFSATWARTPIEFKNPDATYHEKRPLVRFWPGNHFEVLYLPSEVDPDVGRRAIVRAIALCARYGGASHAAGHVISSIVVYLTDLKNLSVVERRVHFKPGKYRGDAKFSNAFKPKTLRTEEVELERVGSDDARRPLYGGFLVEPASRLRHLPLTFGARLVIPLPLPSVATRRRFAWVVLASGGAATRRTRPLPS